MKHLLLGVLAVSCHCLLFSQTTISLQPNSENGKDAEVWSLEPDSNYGEWTQIRANAWTWGGSFGKQRGYFQFDLDTIPEDAILIEAKLNLYGEEEGNSQLHSGSNASWLRRVTEDWSESDLTWDNQPLTTDLNQVELPMSTGGYEDYLDVDVTNLVQDMIDNPEESFGFQFRLQSESTYRRMTFKTSDFDDGIEGPELILTYSIDTGDVEPTTDTCIILKPGPDEGFDAEVWSLEPTTNFGDHDELRSNAWTWSGDFGIQRSFFRFDLDAIPAGYYIESATLNLYGLDEPDTQLHSGANASGIRRVTEDWDEFEITWDNQPASTTEDQVTLDAATSGYEDFLDIDVTEMVNDMLLEGNYGFMMRLQVEETYRRLGFASSDHINEDSYPELILCLTTDPPDTTIVDPDPLPDSCAVLKPGPIEGFDAEVWSLEPTTNFGDHDELRANAWTWGGEYGIQRSYFRFNLDTIPDTMELIYAELSLFGLDPPDSQLHSGENESFIRRVLEDWDEYTINWDNQPTSTTTNEVLNDAATSGYEDFTGMDVTELVKDMIEEGNYGFLLQLQNEGIYRRLGFASSDHSNPDSYPELYLCWGEPTIDTTTTDTSVFEFPEDSCIVLKPGSEEGYDAEVWDLLPTTNYGNHDELRSNAWTWSGDVGVQRSFLRFNLDTIPTGYYVESALLNLYGLDDPDTQLHSGDNESSISRVTEEWGELTINWDNQPPTTEEDQVLLDAATSGYEDFLDIDVTDMVNDMLIEGNYGFMMRLQVEATYRRLGFASSDHVNPDSYPELVLCLTAVPPDTTVIEPIPDSCAVLKPGPEYGFDAEVWSLEPTTNFGDHDELRANAWTWSGDYGIQRSFFKFDLDTVPDDMELVYAELSLFGLDDPDTQLHSGDNESYIRRVIEDWDEFTLNWDNQPPTTIVNQVLNEAATSGYEDFTGIDVTEMVKDMIDYENYGFMLRLQDEGIYRRLGFASSDHINASSYPELFLCWGEKTQDTTIIDTTIVNPGDSCILLKPGSDKGYDAEIWSLLPTTNYGDHDELRSNAWTWSGDFGIQRSLFKFDLDTIPSGYTVVSAELSLFGLDDPDTQLHSGDNDSYIRRITEDWGEYTVNWDNQPETTTENQVALEEATSGYEDFLDIDVTDMVLDMLEEENYGFLMRLQTEATYRRLGFASSDHVNPDSYPELLLCLEEVQDTVIVVNPGDSCIVLKPDAENGIDAEVWSLDPNTNYGTHDELRANAWTWFGDLGIQRSFLKFDLDELPEGAILEYAGLSLFGLDEPDTQLHSGPNQSFIRRVIEDWNEETITWDNQPAVTITNQVENGASTSGYEDFTDIDVTEMVQDMIDDENYGFMLRLQEEGLYRRLGFASSDHENSESYPELELCFSLPVSIDDPVQEPTIVIELYPNPATTQIIIETSFSDAEISFYTIYGQLLISADSSSPVRVFDISSLQPGTYIVKIVNGDRIYYEKFNKI